MDASSQFNTLLKTVNPLNGLISPEILNLFGFNGDIMSAFNAFNQAKNSVNPVEDMINFFVDLDGKLESITDPGIVKGWMQQFSSMPQSIIDGVLSKIPQPTFLNRGFSDSIGGVSKVQNYRDESVIPNLNVKDTLVDIIDTGMKLPSYIEENLNKVGQTTKQLLNKNLSGIVGTIGSSDVAHGANLVPDSLHLERFSSIANDYLSKATETFSGASNFLQQVLSETPFAGTNVAAPVFDVIQKVEGLSVAVNSAGQDIVNLPQKAISLLTTPIS